MMYIFFDTNIVLQNKDYFFVKKIKELSSLSEKFEEIKVCIPEAIKDEIVKKYLDESLELISKYKEIEKINKRVKLLEENNVTKLDREVLYEGYKNNLECILKQENIEILEYPKDGSYIKNVMRRVTLCKKPFQGKKESYRDAFIWYAILDFSKKINEDDRIVFITGNTNDFFDKENKTLHEDFKEELDENKEIILYEKINDFIENDEYLDYLIKKREEEIEERRKIEEIEETEEIEIEMERYVYDTIKNNINQIILEKSKEIIEHEIINYIDNGTIIFDENIPYDSYMSLESIDSIKAINIDYKSFNILEGVIYLYIEVEIDYTKLLKNIMYDGDIDDQEFIYKYGNHGIIEMNLSIYIDIENERLEKIELPCLREEFDKIKLETTLDVRDIDINYINAKL